MSIFHWTGACVTTRTEGCVTVDRYQSTSVSNSSSSPSQLMYGVPQGSVLGPIVFVLYTTPLSDIIANHAVNHQLFADNTQLQKSAPFKKLNACTDDIKTWMTEISSNWTTTKQKLFSFPFRLPWNLLQFPSLIRLLLALTTSPSLILPGTLDSFLTQNCPVHEEARHKNLPNCLFRA